MQPIAVAEHPRELVSERLQLREEVFPDREQDVQLDCYIVMGQIQRALALRAVFGQGLEGGKRLAAHRLRHPATRHVSELLHEATVGSR